MIVLFGPPGVGKSTLISQARARGWDGIDTDSALFQSRRVMVTLAAHNAGGLRLIAATADLNPGLYPSEALKVLLLPPRGKYAMRRLKRDLRRPWLAIIPDVYYTFEKNQSQFDVVVREWTGWDDLEPQLRNVKLHVR